MNRQYQPSGTTDPKSWDMVGSLNLSKQLTTGRVLLELADEGNDDLVVLTADLGRPTQVKVFGDKYPNRYFNFGIAERNMIGAAAGLATIGWKPIISNYSFFLALMGVENIRNDICYTNLPVRMVGTHSGIAMGFYGTSHHCNEDIGALRSIANLTLMAPCDGNALEAALRGSIEHEMPIYFRVGRGREEEVYEKPPDWKIGGSNVICEGRDALILAIGNLVHASMKAHELLASQGIGLKVIDCYSINPLDTNRILDEAKKFKMIFTAEEHNVTGGFGTSICDTIAQAGLGTRVIKIGMPDQYSILGPPIHLYRHYGLDGAGIASKVHELLE
ncbi:MAG: transketolase C-terminal domain-containing protein [SAR324 cluster bacterium]|jgi:transketolase|nr:transketolase C-terminal domain-containing protein [SAR324 cluster bacterium]MDP7500100.1 transketolase C-terminal domain-containing protein [SAR324 cluster bacterium]|tara:strand:+ start:9147 stop:10142 length:996 start_codon:yes stop_codon:yes gene_type:complete